MAGDVFKSYKSVSSKINQHVGQANRPYRHEDQIQHVGQANRPNRHEDQIPEHATSATHAEEQKSEPDIQQPESVSPDESEDSCTNIGRTDSKSVIYPAIQYLNNQAVYRLQPQQLGYCGS